MSPRSRPTRPVLAFCALAAALAGACDGGPTQPDVPDAIRVTGGAALTDTVDGIHAVTVTVTSGGHAAAGAIVQLTALPLADCVDCTVPTAMVAAANVGTLAASASVVTNASGEGEVVVRVGKVAGAGRLRVAVPTLGLEDTLTFTVSPGRAVATRVLPRDSVVYLNTTLRMRAAVVDRWGNPRSEAVTLTAASGLTLAGDVVTGSAYGVGKVTVQSAGLPADSTRVMVVPHGTLAAVTGYRGSGIAVFDLDGSNRTTVPVTAQVNGMDWAPDGTHLVVSLGETLGPRKLFTITPAGAQAQLFAGSALTDAMRPVFSHDGRWMYFVGATAAGQGQIWRAHADGSGLERVGTGLELAKSVGPSPDGSRVAYSRATFADPLQILTVSTGAVTSLSLVTEGIRWSPTTDRFALRQIGGPATVGLDGTGLRTYTEYMGFDDPYAPWSPDGSWIVCNSGPLELIQVDTGLRIPLPYAGGYTQAAWKR
jgi:hypothetical protein